ncbi:anti-sigma factor [Acaryochloris sp. CCMEE 5410]|uniref:anti-sigma factor family protein n=1 Tax=Acaryochloris sp. CCMEE 5410 TaxID=310037 RepID=UPI0002484076|nr:hypothetical protein [Acaryochloris sp. CCMEE 5410]KAI9135225.1 hypothetical protein ON05_019605 [Acaryochloris sp. CCMEE 5410]
MDDIKTIEFDRFELLSAYLDDEASAAERKQVEAWLATDPEFSQCYQQLLQLQRGFQSTPAPTSTPVEQTAEAVFSQVERKPKLALWATVGTAAAVSVAAITGLFSGGGSLIPQTAQNSENAENATVAINSQSDNLKPSDLLIAIEQSPVDIPVAINLSDTEAR